MVSDKTMPARILTAGLHLLLSLIWLNRSVKL